MKPLLQSLMALSVIVLVASIVIEVRALTGADVGDRSAFEWIISAFAILMLFVTVRMAARVKSFEMPPWLKCFFVFFVVCVFIDLCSTSRFGGEVSRIDGVPELEAKGKFVRTLSESEYRERRAYEVRYKCKWWILYFSFETAYFYALVKSIDRPSFEKEQPD